MINLEQNTAEWLDFRKDKIGASTAGVIMGVDPWTTPLQLWERMHGLREEIQETEAMRLGKELEADARIIANKTLGLEFSPQVMVHPEYDWLMASLDGLSKEGNIILEIKCGGKDLFKKATDGEIPAYYHHQMQHQMFVSGCRMAFYMCCLVDREKGEIKEYILKGVPYDEKLALEIFAKEKEFYFDYYKSLIQPPMTDKDFMYRPDGEWQETVKRFLEVRAQREWLDEQEESLKNSLISMSGGVNSKGAGITLTKILRKGSINYKAIPEISNVNLELYRSKPIEMWRITQEK